MRNPIFELVEKEMARFNAIWEQDRNRPPNHRIFFDQDNFYPIPFFGDIRRAEVLTFALNPSYHEFTTERWPNRNGCEALTTTSLVNRLLSYFHLVQFQPHPWFDECEKGLLALGCSYERNAAHIDVHPLPTKFASQMNQEESTTLAEIIRAQSAGHVTSVLKLCERAKLIIVVDYAVPSGGTTFDFLRGQIPALIGLSDPQGIQPPIIRGGRHTATANYLFAHRSRLRSFLLNAPRLIF